MRARLDAWSDRPARVGGVVLVLCAVVIYLSFTRSVPFLPSTGDRTLRAEFIQTSELRTGDPVRVGGVQVGTVADIALDAARGRGVVTMRLTNGDVVLHRDARADLRWGTLLGGSLYVDLDPGTRATPVDQSGWVPLSRTTTQVEFDQQLQPLSGPTGHALQVDLREVSRALADGAAVRRAIKALAPNLETVGQGLRPLQGQAPGDLERLVSTTARTLKALATDRASLRRVVVEGARTLAVTAAHRRPFGSAIALSPAALEQTTVTTRRLVRTLDVLDPTVAALRPGTRELPQTADAAAPALAGLADLLSDARPTLRALRPALLALRRAAAPGRRFMTAFIPTVDRLRDELLPFLDRTDPESGRSTAQMIGPFFAATGAAAAEFDNAGNWLHFPNGGDENTLLDSPCQTSLSDPTAVEKVRCRALETILRRVLGGKR